MWDYQQLTGGSEEDGFALEPEVGLFAMKRDQVARALAPLEEAGIEVDLIQLAPLAVYNYVCFDRLEELKSQPYDPAKPPASTVVISLGTDTTDLVVTNGFRVWQRNIPIGGNHFTRALSKELKLTFVKAEHLKRNATQADDPKAVFQAMRPVFSDLLAEIQRSLGYFMSLDKAAQIGEVIALGNAMKLPGLQRYLAQNLEQDVKPIEEFNRLSAGSAGGNAQFKDNVLSFAPAYGLCVQALGKSELKTNLLPEEIVTQADGAGEEAVGRGRRGGGARGADVQLLHARVGVARRERRRTTSWTPAISRRPATKHDADGFETTRTGDSAPRPTTIIEIQNKLTSNVEGRLRWLELIKAIDAALPKDERPREETAEHVMSRNELHITAIDNQYFTRRGDRVLHADRARRTGSRRAAGPAARRRPPSIRMPPCRRRPWRADPALAGGCARRDGSRGPADGPGLGDPAHGLPLPQRATCRTTRSGSSPTRCSRTWTRATVELPDGPDGELIDVPIEGPGDQPCVAGVRTRSWTRTFDRSGRGAVRRRGHAADAVCGDGRPVRADWRGRRRGATKRATATRPKKETKSRRSTRRPACRQGAGSL